MALILSGTDGLSDVDGSAATPAIRGTDTNTGIFFPAADTIAFSEGGVESGRFDSAGRLGIGTTSPDAVLHATATTGKIVRGRNNYYQVRDARVVSTTTNFLSINFNASTYLACAVRIFSTVNAPGVDNLTRADEIYIIRESSGSITITSKLSQGSGAGSTVSYSVSSNTVFLTYPYIAVAPQTNHSYVEIIGMNATSSAESTFTVTIL